MRHMKNRGKDLRDPLLGGSVGSICDNHNNNGGHGCRRTQLMVYVLGVVMVGACVFGGVLFWLQAGRVTYGTIECHKQGCEFVPIPGPDSSTTSSWKITTMQAEQHELNTSARQRSKATSGEPLPANANFPECRNNSPAAERSDPLRIWGIAIKLVEAILGRMKELKSEIALKAVYLSTLEEKTEGMVSATPDNEQGPTLAYGIMIYQRAGYEVEKTLGQFTRMLGAIYDEANTYVIHTDIKSDPSLIEQISAHIRPLPNVYEIPSVSVSWAGITVVERTLALMDKALEVNASWRYFVNIGHEDYPSTSQEEMRRWLKQKPDGTNFIKCWPIEKHDFFGQTEGHANRVKDVHVDDFAGTVREFVTTSGRRGSQERGASGYQFYKSLQQTMLSRDLSEFATRSSEARRLLLYMATSKAPDELYFPTLTMLDERYASKATCDDTRHFSFWLRPGGSWHPEYLTLDHLPKVLNATEFFIRKVEDAQGSKPLLDILDWLRAGNPIDDALPLLTAWLNRPGVEGGPNREFKDENIQDALFELSRRLEELSETKRCMFIQAFAQRRQRMKQRMNDAVKLPPTGPLTQDQTEMTEGPSAVAKEPNAKSFRKRGDLPRNPPSLRKNQEISPEKISVAHQPGVEE